MLYIKSFKKKHYFHNKNKEYICNLYNHKITQKGNTKTFSFLKFEINFSLESITETLKKGNYTIIKAENKFFFCLRKYCAYSFYNAYPVLHQESTSSLKFTISSINIHLLFPVMLMPMCQLIIVQ